MPLRLLTLLLLSACTRIYYAPPLLADGRGVAIDRFANEVGASATSHAGRVSHATLHGGGTFGLNRRLSLEAHGHLAATQFDTAWIGGLGFLHRTRIHQAPRPFDVSWGLGGAYGTVQSDQPTQLGGGWVRAGIATTHRLIRPFGDLHAEHLRDTRAADASRFSFSAGLDIGSNIVTLRAWTGAQLFHGDAQIGSSCRSPPADCASPPRWERWTNGSWSLGLSLHVALPGADRRLAPKLPMRSMGPTVRPVPSDQVLTDLTSETERRALGLLTDRYLAAGLDLDGPGAVDDARAVAALLQAGASVDAILQLLQRIDVPGGAAPYAARTRVSDTGTLERPGPALRLAERIYERQRWVRIGPPFADDVDAIERALRAGRPTSEILQAARKVAGPGELGGALEGG